VSQKVSSFYLPVAILSLSLMGLSEVSFRGGLIAPLRPSNL
jgi:hypothetical protein